MINVSFWWANKVSNLAKNMLKLLLCNITGSLDLIFTDVQKFVSKIFLRYLHFYTAMH